MGEGSPGAAGGCVQGGGGARHEPCGSASSGSLCSFTADGEEGRGIERRHRFLSCRFALYALGCFAVTVGFSAITIGLWSDMGCSTRCLDFLEANGDYSLYCAGIVCILVLILYWLDFFMPTHLPGRYLVLADGNGCLGRSCLVLAVIALLGWAYLSARSYPTLPFTVTNLFCPLSVVLLRRTTMPAMPERPQKLDGLRGLDDRLALIKLLTWEERDEKNFYTAAMCSFLAAGALSLAAWSPWAAAQEAEFGRQMAEATSQGERELMFVRWAVPVFVAISNFVFAGFAGLRVSQNGAYSATDRIKNQLILDAKMTDNQRVTHYRISILKARAAASHNQADLKRTTEDKLQKYLVQHISHMRRLSKIVKSVGSTMVALILALHIVFQMTTAVSHTAAMVQGLLASYLGVFAVFIFVSFNRVSRSMSLELMDLQVLRNIAACGQADWAKALLSCLALPLLPVILAVSVVNQRVRRLRGICQSSCLLTRRVESALQTVRAWQWVQVFGWCYIWAGVLMIFRVCPILLNVFLAWLGAVVEGLDFWIICAVTFAIGTFLFMLPPVPGPIIYPFAGIVISDPKTCPFGFWWGSAISVGLCFVMKMVTTIFQQKVGELMGHSTTIRRAVGIHKPAIRAIENVLKRPGLSIGKCMILCGGPDWPTSVLAGILRLSIGQCLIGTVPVIFSITPMSLTGSFYLKREESEVWTRTGNLMLFLTTLVSAVFLAGIGFALQDEYDKGGDELTRPKEEYLELEWLDHRAACVGEKCKVQWRELPRIVKCLFGGGAIMATLTGHLFLWCASRCWGAFTITDDVHSLRWSGADGLIRPLGSAGLAVAAASYIGNVTCRLWSGRHNRGRLAEALEELGAEEASWKAHWLQEARRVNGHKQCPSEVPTLLSSKSLSEVDGLKSPGGPAAAACAGAAEACEQNAPRRWAPEKPMRARGDSDVSDGAGGLEAEEEEHDGDAPPRSGAASALRALRGTLGAASLKGRTLSL